MPNLLVGAGLLFTFLGLAVALRTAGGVVAGSANIRNAALQVLLNTAGFKFFTSLAGMALSIVYAIAKKSRMHRVDKSLDRFLEALEQRVPLLSPLALQQEQIALLERQSTQLETFSTDLAVALGSAFDQAFNERLAEHVGPLTQAMQRLSENMSSRNEEAMQTMLETFLQRLEGGSGEHIKGVAESLSVLAERLEGLQSGLGDAAVQMAQSADAMAARMGEGAEAALARITQQMSGLAESLRALADETRDAGAQAGGAMADRIAAAAAGFEATSARVAEALERSAFASGGAFGRGAEDAVSRIATTTEAMQDGLRGVLAELQATLGQAGDSLRTGSAESAAAMRATLDDGAGALVAALSAAAQTLMSAGGEAGASLEKGGAVASEHLIQAGGTFGERATGLAKQITALAAATEAIAERGIDFERAAAAAAEPLASSASDLKLAGQSARAALDPLAQTSQSMARAIEQVAGTAQQLENAAGAATRLINTLNEASRRFEGVDRELAKTLDGLQTGLYGFTKNVSEFVSRTDDNLAKAATQLGQLVKSLEETLADYAPAAGVN